MKAPKAVANQIAADKEATEVGDRSLPFSADQVGVIGSCRVRRNIDPFRPVTRQGAADALHQPNVA